VIAGSKGRLGITCRRVSKIPVNAFRPFPRHMIMRLMILAALCLVSVTAQSFEVASVRPSQPPSGPRIRVSFEGGPGSSSPTRFSCRNCSLAMLVMRAYDVEYSQIAGLKTHSDDLYDVEATLPTGTTRVQFRAMLQGPTNQTVTEGGPVTLIVGAQVRVSCISGITRTVHRLPEQPEALT